MFLRSSVDSLLQIHALHNLLQILPLVGQADDNDESAGYKQSLNRLQSKFMDNSNSLVKKKKMQNHGCTTFLLVNYFRLKSQTIK